MYHETGIRMLPGIPVTGLEVHCQAAGGFRLTRRVYFGDYKRPEASSFDAPRPA